MVTQFSMGHTVLSLALIWLCAATPTRANIHHPSSSWHRTWTRVWRRSSSSSSTKNVPAAGYYVPMDSGGSMLTSVPDTFPPGQGEPINVILSANSDSRVLQDQETDGGLRNYFLSFGFSGECLGQHAGSDQEANIGDGDGYLNETAVIRWNYGDAQLGACKETIQGGNHFRYWVQDGPSANSGAIFMAISYEMPLSDDHDIIFNGYNLARDWLIGNITGKAVPTPNVTNATTFTGTTSWANYTYETDIKYVSGLLNNTNIGINHNLTVGAVGINATDGLVAVLNVTITGAPPATKSFAWRQSPPQFWQLPSLILVLVLTCLPAIVS